ncbi:MAG: LamG domain-containing protein [Candidatus Planktophila sp.]
MQRSVFQRALFLPLILALAGFFAAPASAAAGESDTYINTDTTGRYATIASNSALGTFNAISIEFWFKSSLANCDGNLVTKGVQYAVYCAAGNLNFAFTGNGTVAGTTVRYAISTAGVTNLKVPQNEWHHFAITRAANTNTVTTYWDGQVLSSNQSADGAGTGALVNGGDAFNIGARRNGTTYFSGAIDEVRLSNVVRTQAEIQSDMHRWGIGSQTGVVAYYDFNDISGSTVIDRVGSNDLSLVGSPTISPVENTSQVGNDTVIKFPRSYLTSQGGWKVPAGLTKMESLVVGGGGAGGSRSGGGGGAGGYVATALATLTFTPGAVETITVGQGGVGQHDTRGSNGGNSLLGNRRIALGGGGGGSASGADNSLRNGANGGSGGGAATLYSAGIVAGISTQNSTYSYGLGNSGALAKGANYFQGGGGGGSSSAALIAAGTTSSDWSDGGNGTANSITGAAICYATGGGGGSGLGNAASSQYLNSNGGNCGGGANPNGGRGTYGKIIAMWGAANSGAGGGGTGWDDSVAGSDLPGGSGGSGVIILRYTSTLNTTFNAPATATYRQASTLSVTTTMAAKVTFFANGKRIPNCITIATDGANSASCNWTPSIRGQVTISVVVTPSLIGVAPATSTAALVVAKRTTQR